MPHRTCSLLLLLAALGSPGQAQQITLRDTITPLPAVSFCMDGATHRTVCTGHRLRPGSLGPLAQYEGFPLEITGTPGAITCQFVTVSAIAIVPNDQLAVTTVTPVTMTVDFFGAGPAGDVYLLFLGAGIAPLPLWFPQFAGPVHLDVNAAWFAGIYVPLGLGTPYCSLAFPHAPALLGVPLYDQALVLHASGLRETTVVNRFQF
jgi:hypothetical protein